MLFNFLLLQSEGVQGAVHGEAVRDTAMATHQMPLPGGVSTALRFVFNLPQWLQVTVAATGIVAAVVFVAFIWRRNRALLAWLASRSHRWKVAAASVAGVVLLAFAAFGFAGFNYMEHENSFCVSCHVMTPAFERFRTSEHSKLECHDCHKQSMYANARQLYFWIADRPDEIGKHAPVPDRICEGCHKQNVDPARDSVWKRVAATAGHRLHLNSTDPKLRGVGCVTCHGATVHQFKAADKTCGQSGCHQNTHIGMGRMANQTSLHCATCHEFNARVTEVVSVDSTKHTLTPKQEQCFGCHQMREKMASFVAADDPHRAVCGTCHDPHKQALPRDAFRTCTNAGCHARPDTLTAFHRGLPAAELSECGSCHRAHEWKVKGGSCLSCHKDIYDEGRPAHVARRPAAAERTSARPVEHAAMLASLAPGLPATLAERLQRAQGNGASRATADSTRFGMPFSHRRHRGVECTSCHSTTGTRHGQLLVGSRRDCQSCHHTARSGATCATCHSPAELADARRVDVPFELPKRAAPLVRSLGFRHAVHSGETCATCHTTPVTLAPDKACASCHADHHEPTRDCRSCHVATDNSILKEHTRSAHEGCAGGGCHAAQQVASLRPTRNVCLSCHQNQVKHKPGKDCVTCHQTGWNPSATGGR